MKLIVKRERSQDQRVPQCCTIIWLLAIYALVTLGEYFEIDAANGCSGDFLHFLHGTSGGVQTK